MFHIYLFYITIYTLIIINIHYLYMYNNILFLTIYIYYNNYIILITIFIYSFIFTASFMFLLRFLPTNNREKLTQYQGWTVWIFYINQLKKTVVCTSAFKRDHWSWYEELVPLKIFHFKWTNNSVITTSLIFAEVSIQASGFSALLKANDDLPSWCLFTLSSHEGKRNLGWLFMNYVSSN